MARCDLSDEEWALLKPLLPPERSGNAGPPYRSHRRVLNGIFRVLRTGAPWRDLPGRYGPWTTIHDRFHRWSRAGLFDQTLRAVEAKARRQRRIDFAFASVPGDKGYDSVASREAILARGGDPPIPHRHRPDGSYPATTVPFDQPLNTRRNVVVVQLWMTGWTWVMIPRRFASGAVAPTLDGGKRISFDW